MAPCHGHTSSSSPNHLWRGLSAEVNAECYPAGTWNQIPATDSPIPAEPIGIASGNNGVNLLYCSKPEM
ncbi:hypothetical protein Mapa_000314 [Marchantia paleacea]|nr:hypothetical protein Mapa_000314 [Marchantia paleacea]